jgi:hypothetical protein
VCRLRGLKSNGTKSYSNRSCPKSSAVQPHPYRHGFSLKDSLRLPSVQSKRWLVPPAQRRGSTDLDAPSLRRTYHTSFFEPTGVVWQQNRRPHKRSTR